MTKRMKHSLKVTENCRIFTVITEGDGDVEGIIAFLKDIIDHPQWVRGNYILLDHRALKINSITVSGREAVSEYFKSISYRLGNGKIALVMKRDVDYGIARAWEIITQDDVDIEVNVFLEYEKALDWLKNNKSANHPIQLTSRAGRLCNIALDIRIISNFNAQWKSWLQLMATFATENTMERVCYI